MDPDLIRKPDWKESRSARDKAWMAEFDSLTIEEALPKNRYRLAYLKDGDQQLNRLLDFFERILHLPMGSDDWADRAICAIRRLRDQEEAVSRLRLDLRESGLRSPELERFDNRVKNAWEDYRKFSPEAKTRCDWCGWEEPDVRLVGGGYAACSDCWPKQEGDSDEQN